MIARRFLVLTLLAIAVIATGAQAQNFPGPPSPALARLYFYRIVESNEATRWTGVFLNDDKIGDLGERSYFFRDIQPGTYKIGVSSDVPYSDQYRTIAVTANQHHVHSCVSGAWLRHSVSGRRPECAAIDLSAERIRKSRHGAGGRAPGDDRAVARRQLVIRRRRLGQSAIAFAWPRDFSGGNPAAK